MIAVVMDEEVFLIDTIVSFFHFVAGYQKWDTATCNWNRATKFVSDYQSGHSSVSAKYSTPRLWNMAVMEFIDFTFVEKTENKRSKLKPFFQLAQCCVQREKNKTFWWNQP